ncbi:hypothetical protein [Brevundimonas sp.]|nr:hypothetical protein [Brevundimonas sp.]HYC74698.1 hypothetical protein [Brevundimonas sp.]
MADAFTINFVIGLAVVGAGIAGLYALKALLQALSKPRDHHER